MEKVLVTGGAGFIGSHLVEALLEKGCRLNVLDNLSGGSLSNLDHIKDQINFIQGDIRDPEISAEAAQGCDTVFHLAAMVSVPQSVQNPHESATVNDLGTLTVLEAARRQKVSRFIFSSSCAVYGDDPLLPKKESMLPKPLSPYAIHKLTAEHYTATWAKLHGLKTISLRYFNVFGPRQDPTSPYSGVISIFMTKANKAEMPVIFGDGKQYRDFIYVKDVVAANLLAVKVKDAGGEIFNIGTGRFVRINTLWEKICAVAGIRLAARHAAPRPGDIVESVADIARAGAMLGFEPEFSFEKGLAATYEWYRTNV